VSDAVVNSRIRTLRQSVDDDGKSQRLIKTFHKRGFRFVGDVDVVSCSEAEDAPAPEEVSEAETAGGQEATPAAATVLSQAAGARRSRARRFTVSASAGALFALIAVALVWAYTVMDTDETEDRKSVVQEVQEKAERGRF
jgi:hypothetical protein